MRNWDCEKKKYIETSEELKKFFEEIKIVCKKYNLSIGHEDGHGSFEIQKFSDDNIDWLINANLRLS